MSVFRTRCATGSDWRSRPRSRQPEMPAERPPPRAPAAQRQRSRSVECSAADRGKVLRTFGRADQTVVGKEDDALSAGATRGNNVIERFALGEAGRADA